MALLTFNLNQTLNKYFSINVSHETIKKMRGKTPHLNKYQFSIKQTKNEIHKPNLKKHN